MTIRDEIRAAVIGLNASEVDRLERMIRQREVDIHNACHEKIRANDDYWVSRVIETINKAAETERMLRDDLARRSTPRSGW